MPPDDWQDILLRLAAALGAGALLGIDRTARGRPAGLRTTMLVSLAAAVAMLLGMELLKETNGGRPFDPLRIAQGILAGMGFIGAGAIIRRGDAVMGVTTAATLWLGTVLGLTFGAGEWVAGGLSLALGAAVLWGLHPIEDRVHRERKGTLFVTVPFDGPHDDDLRRRIEQAGCTTWSWAVQIHRERQTRRIACSVTWRARPGDDHPPSFVEGFAADPRIRALAWKPRGS